MNSPSVNSNEAPPIEPRKNAWIFSPEGIVAVYLVVGALWILLSDLVVAALFPDRDSLASAQTFKGWFFVAITALLLYALIRRTVYAVKFARGAQAESESNYRMLVEQIPAVTYVAIPKGGGTTYMSPQAQPLLGYSPDEWNGIPDMWHRVLHPDDHDRVAAELEQTYRTGKRFLTEYRMVARDGRTFWCRDEATVTLYGDKPVRLQGVMVDITERKAAEEALRRERDFSSTVLDITASLVIVLDAEGRIIRFNQACERLLGYSAAEVVGRSMWEDLFLPEEKEGVREQFAQLRSGQLLNEYTSRVVTRSGETRLVSWSNSAMLDAAGNVDYIVVTGTDITERQANEQQLQEQAELQTRLLRELLTAQEAERHRLSMEIHDGPLQSLGVSLMALDRAMRREERGEVDHSLLELQNLRITLANTVGEVRSVLADLSLDLLQQQGLVPALSDHAHRFSEITGIEVHLEQYIRERLPKHIELMAYRLAQEALSNVRKHANASEVEIKMKAEDNCLVMSITDNGQGFDANAAQIDSLPGERLGLRSMQERVHNARGDFTLESGAGAGTTLTFVVPYANS